MLLRWPSCYSQSVPKQLLLLLCYLWEQLAETQPCMWRGIPALSPRGHAWVVGWVKAGGALKGSFHFGVRKVTSWGLQKLGFSLTKQPFVVLVRSDGWFLLEASHHPHMKSSVGLGSFGATPAPGGVRALLNTSPVPELSKHLLLALERWHEMHGAGWMLPRSQQAGLREGRGQSPIGAVAQICPYPPIIEPIIPSIPSPPSHPLQVHKSPNSTPNTSG